MTCGITYTVVLISVFGLSGKALSADESLVTACPLTVMAYVMNFIRPRGKSHGPTRPHRRERPPNDTKLESEGAEFHVLVKDLLIAGITLLSRLRKRSWLRP
jgi:hypothetical protein